MPTLPQLSSLSSGADALQAQQRSPNPFSRPERIRLRGTPTFEHPDPPAAVDHAKALERRTTFVALPETYYGLNAGPAPGTVAGITLGTVLGFLLVLWLVFILVNNTAMDNYIEGDEIDINISRREGRSQRTRTHRSTHRSTHHSEMSDRRSAAPSSHHTRQPSRSPRRRTERIIVEETRRTERSQPPPISPSSVRETERISIHEREERRVAGDDVVEVIEEHSDVSPEPRRKKKSSGFRTVDPNEYAGGNYPQRNLDRNRSRR